MVLQQLDISMQKMKLDSYLIPSIKFNSKWIRDLHVRAMTRKLLEENVGVNLCNLGLGNGSLIMNDTKNTSKN